MLSPSQRIPALALALGIATASCGGDTDPTTIPDGVYRAQVSVEDLIGAGVGTFEANGNGGVQRMTIDGDTFVFSVQSSPPSCFGTLSYEADRVSWIHGGPPNCGLEAGTELLSANWEMDGDDLTVQVIEAIGPLYATLWGSQPWEKVE